MPSTQIKDGLYLVKVRKYGESRAVSIPPKVASAAKLVEGFFVGMLAIGPCVVMVPISQATPDGSEEEICAAFEAAIREWKKSHGEEFAEVRR